MLPNRCAQRKTGLCDWTFPKVRARPITREMPLRTVEKGFQGIALIDKRSECCTCFWGKEVQRTVSDDGMIWTDIFDHSLKTSWVTYMFVHITFHLPVWSFVILVVTLKIIFDLAGIMWWLYGKLKALWKWSRSYFLGNQWTYLKQWGKRAFSH